MNNILVHKHLIVRAEAVSPPVDEEFLRRWFEKFIKDIGMKVMMGHYISPSTHHVDGSINLLNKARYYDKGRSFQ
jgi:hypothetical protein